MSISTFQEKIFKSGCGVAVLVISAAAMAFSMVVGQCNRGGMQRENVDKGPIAIQMGEITVPAAEVEQLSQQMMQMQPDQSAGPRQQTMALAQVLDGKVRDIANLAVAKEVGADTSDDAIKAFVTKQLDKIIADSRQQYIDTKKIKPTATEKEFADQFKKDRGQTPEEFRKTAFENVEKTLADPAAKQSMVTQIASQLALEKVKASINPSEADLKASYDTYVMKRVMVSTTNKAANDAEAQLKKAGEEIRSGKSFEDVMNRYSNDLPPGAGKKVSEVVVNLNPSDIALNPAMAGLKTLKPGQVSDIIDVPGGKAIYKLISVKNSAPADFSKNIKKYRDQFIDQQASAELQKKVEAITKSDSVQFPLPGYKAIRDYYTTMVDFSLMNQPGAQETKFRAIADAAKAAMEDKSPADDHAALLAWYSAVEDLYNRAKADPAKAKALLAERQETLASVLRESESFQTRLDLVDLAIETKNAELAAQSLLEAARLNNTFDTTGDRQFRDIQTRLAKMKIAKLVDGEQAKLIEAEQQRWRTDKAENAQAEKEFKAQQEAEKKKTSAEAKKLEAEQKKMEEDTKKEIANQKKAGGTTAGQ